MNTIHIEASHIVPANIEQVYAVVADYKVGHSAILPRPAFQEMQILEGGYGAGTRLHLHVKMFGQSYYYDQLVSEPEVGRVIRETDINTGQYSEFHFEALGDYQTKVTILSEMPASSGLRGWMERLTQPSIISKLYKTELKNLEAYLQQQVPATSKA